jgi:hypothetical protein
MHVAVDACFQFGRLQKNTLNVSKSSISLFMKEVDDLKHSTNKINSSEFDCSSLFTAAGDGPKKKKSILDETGIIGKILDTFSGLSCARHDVPILYGDLYNGEKMSAVDSLLEQLKPIIANNKVIHKFIH